MIVVATDGRPINIRVVNSLAAWDSGRRRPSKPSAPGASEPGQKDGHPVNVEMAVEVDFHLY